LSVFRVLPIEPAGIHYLDAVSAATFVQVDNVEPKSVRIRKSGGKLRDLVASVVEILGIEAHALPGSLEIVAAPAAKRPVRSDLAPISVKKRCAFIPTDRI
jgi:hypothetical protein